MRARIRLLKPERSEDDLGGASLTWSDQGSAWAEIAPQNAREDAGADALRGRAFYRVKLRKRPDVRAGWRVVWDGRTLRVLATLDALGVLARLQLDCEEIQ